MCTAASKQATACNHESIYSGNFFILHPSHVVLSMILRMKRVDTSSDNPYVRGRRLSFAGLVSLRMNHPISRVFRMCIFAALGFRKSWAGPPVISSFLVLAAWWGCRVQCDILNVLIPERSWFKLPTSCSIVPRTIFVDCSSPVLT